MIPFHCKIPHQEKKVRCSMILDSFPLSCNPPLVVAPSVERQGVKAYDWHKCRQSTITGNHVTGVHRHIYGIDHSHKNMQWFVLSTAQHVTSPYQSPLKSIQKFYDNEVH